MPPCPFSASIEHSFASPGMRGDIGELGHAGLGRANSYGLGKVKTSEIMQYKGTHCYFQVLLNRVGQRMDLKRTANVKQMLRGALFDRQSCVGKGRRKRKSNGQWCCLFHVFTGHHHISCTMALLQRCIVDESSSLQTNTVLWREPCGDSSVLWPPGHRSHCPHHSHHSRQEEAKEQHPGTHCNCKCWEGAWLQG